MLKAVLSGVWLIAGHANWLQIGDVDDLSSHLVLSVDLFVILLVVHNL